MKQYDVIVVGGGHAGTEAAAAAARRGARVAFVTQSLAQIGTMSCNPSIGGLGKGHLVREVDALDGVMARAADDAGIHYRMLNRSKGLAVQGPRLQADRRRYRVSVQRQLAAYHNIDLVEREAVDLRLAGTRVTGIVLQDGSTIDAPAVVLATGTFLGGKIFRGLDREAGGRIDERPANLLGERLRELKLAMGRLKTGTPPRLDGRTIDWASLEPQPSDDETWRMSPMTRAALLPQLACAITRTSAETHDIIRDGLETSPLYAGAIEGGGPRYCPSIEDKVHRFGDRDGHQIFLEPEGLDDHLVYPNGISTSLSAEVQDRMVRSVVGLEAARIVQYGYAVEYDYIDPRSLDHRLELAALSGLFCAGQLNGTTGYEEAAAQGVIAGANAAASALDLPPVIVDRARGYIGVMIDDLVLQGVSEPYRMLTARAEYRLALRADNAETRLSSWADGLSLLTPARQVHLEARTAMRASARNDDIEDVDDDIVREVEEDRRYAPYLQRQSDEIERMRRDGGIAITSDRATLNTVPGLSTEMIERLERAAPKTLDEASRVRGVTPAAVAALWLHSRRKA
ncbi:tRNA uridine-5-carboxymethylaminomethyl(34) synthesis enzyme MnmG [uncultured Sphingomonas sp.]|uniref:tRNA uridine-5-carboxymethylaminomethyl(34) synthesis enzyme MnmG n=1 Tax=uncultured Sphingomonas sp. TaxID=158754 RepID=UPI0030F5C492